MGGFAFCPGGALIKFNLFTGIKSKAASPLWVIFSINSIIQSHTVLTVLFVTQRSFPDHPSSKAFLQAADAISGALVKEELSVKEEETHGHDAVPPVTEEENPSDKILHPVLPDAQPDYPFAVEVDSADTSPATSFAPEISGGVLPSEVMKEVPSTVVLDEFSKLGLMALLWWMSTGANSGQTKKPALNCWRCLRKLDMMWTGLPKKIGHCWLTFLLERVCCPNKA